MARALSDETMPGASSDVTDGGGRLYVEQLRSGRGGVCVFFNPSTRDAPIYDALVDDPSIQLIKGVQKAPLSPWPMAMSARVREAWDSHRRRHRPAFGDDNDDQLLPGSNSVAAHHRDDDTDRCGSRHFSAGSMTFRRTCSVH